MVTASGDDKEFCESIYRTTTIKIEIVIKLQVGSNWSWVGVGSKVIKEEMK